MPTLTVLPEGKTFLVADNAKFLDVCDQSEVGIPLGCRVGVCGTCLVLVIENGESLSAIKKTEARVLAGIGAPPGARLACQCRIRGDLTVIPAEAGELDTSEEPARAPPSECR